MGRTGASDATLMRPGHFGERSLLRGGDCVVPEAGMRSFFPMINGASQIDQLGVHWFMMVCFHFDIKTCLESLEYWVHPYLAV